MAAPDIHARTRLLLGQDVFHRLRSAKIILFGVGGVGSWCAEGLVRSGVEDLTLVDSDRIAPSNVNRQLMATVDTIGQVKVEALKEHLLRINPDARITARQELYSRETAGAFDLDAYDYVIDCIDALKDKIALILHASASQATFFSSMGAALKVDPTQVRVAEFFSVRGCPLGSMLRKRIRQGGVLPAKPFLCVYSEEVLPNRGSGVNGGLPAGAGSGCDVTGGGDPTAETDPGHGKNALNGSIAPITALFGFTLSGLVIRDIYRRSV